MTPTSIAHIINPVPVTVSTPLYFAQQITIESMIAAKSVAIDQICIQQFYTKFAEDQLNMPESFIPTSDLGRSVLDISNFKLRRQLPLIKDILDRLYKATNAEYLIYSNVDISLMPHFYNTVYYLIELGYQAFTINRRTIPAKYHHIDELPLMYAELGEPHRGWDCFVYHRSLYPRFELGNVCVGAPLVGLVMISNLIAFADKFRQITDLHLTFHLGNERSWHSESKSEYELHNQLEVLKIIRTLDQTIGGFNPKTAPKRYLWFHQNRVISWLYDNILMRYYIPAKYTRSSRNI